MPNRASDEPRTHFLRSIVVTLALVVSAVACGGDETPVAPPPTPPTPAATIATRPTSPPATTPRPAARNTGAFEVADIDLGKAIGPDKTIADPIVVFAPGDTIYAAVASNGQGSSKALKARWT